MPKVTELLDCDDNGIDSFADLVRAKAITHTVIGSFKDYDDVCMRILGDGANIAAAATKELTGKVTPERKTKLEWLQQFPLSEHLIVVDTITSLMSTTIGDAKLGNDTAKPLWTQAMRDKYLNDPQYLTVYNLGTQMIRRRMKNLRARGARLIVTAHEDEQVDLTTQMKKRAPQANKALYEFLIGASSDVFRLEINMEERRNAANEVVLKEGVRLLRLKATADVVAKVHVERQYSDSIPSLIVDPTMPKVIAKMHKEPSFLVLYSAPGSGKGHPLFTNVLTPDGWKKVGDLERGDNLIGSNGKAIRVNEVFERGKLPVYRVTTSDGASVLVDGDHIWQVQTRSQRRTTGKWVLKTTSELMAKPLLEVRGGNRESRGTWFLPIVNPVQHPEADLPLAPYVLGTLLANGHLGGTPIAALNKNDVEIRDRLLAESDSKMYTETTSMRVAVMGARKTIRSLGLYGLLSAEKFIPTSYMFGSIEQRTALLQGLMDGDGHAPPNRRARYSTTSFQLARDVSTLVQSLGGVAHTESRVRDGYTEHSLSIMLPSSVQPFFSPRKKNSYTQKDPFRRIVSIEPAGEEEVRCISVDAKDSLYTTENYIVTHNTTLALSEVVVPQQQTNTTTK